ncbi:hypothetical protein NEFER01_1854 [Nematocida sp. LUAm1]|nr:hypothetical protein NEFER02_1743 [Nematocida sp. LUAm2]KAI5178735.1 hypothetical protein NEFER01_1854 [Nematocida sp. LUAm1]
MRELTKRIKEYMDGCCSMQILVDTWEKSRGRVSEEMRNKVDVYVLFKSLEINRGEDVISHERVLRVSYKSEYTPGILSKYIEVLLSNSELHQEILRVLVYVLKRVEEFSRVRELEERMIILMRQLVERRAWSKEMEEALLVLYEGSSKEGREHFMDILLEEGGNVPERKKHLKRRVLRVLEEETLDGILRSKKMLLMAARHGVEEMLHVCGVLIKEIKHRDNGEKRTEMLSILREVSREVTQRDTHYEVTPRDTLHDLPCTNTSREVTPRDTSREVTPRDTILATCIMNNGLTYDLLDEVSGEDILLLCEVLDEPFGARNGTSYGIRNGDILMKVFEVTGDKKYLSEHKVSSIVNIKRELMENYDWYMEKVFKRNINNSVSLNVLNALLEYSYRGRIVEIAVDLGKMIREMDYLDRTQRFLVKKQENNIRMVSVILKKLIDKTYIRKKDLFKIFSSIEYLISSENKDTLEGISSVLQSILHLYVILDRGVDESLFGLPRLCNALSNTLKDNGKDNGKASEDNVRESGESDTNNCMVVAYRIYRQMDWLSYSYGDRLPFLSLLSAMVECTGDFLVSRVHEEVLPYIYNGYKDTLLINTAETKELGRLLCLLSKYYIPHSTYCCILLIAVKLYESGISEGKELLAVICRLDEHSFISGISLITSCASSPFIKCSTHLLRYIKELLRK